LLLHTARDVLFNRRHRRCFALALLLFELFLTLGCYAVLLHYSIMGPAASDQEEPATNGFLPVYLTKICVFIMHDFYYLSLCNVLPFDLLPAN
jgi:hypothetical protein